jgi:hypothetical protein
LPKQTQSTNQLKHQHRTQTQTTEKAQHLQATTKTSKALQHGSGKKLVMVEICVCVENSAVEKQA